MAYLCLELDELLVSSLPWGDFYQRPFKSDALELFDPVQSEVESTHVLFVDRQDRAGIAGGGLGRLSLLVGLVGTSHLLDPLRKVGMVSIRT